MKEQLISFETAKLAHKAKFKEGQFYCYGEDGKMDSMWGQDDWITFGYYEGSYLAPTQSVLQRWLRDNHRINIDIETLMNDSYIIYSFDLVYILETLHVKPFKARYDSYEEALEVGLLEALKLIK